jgi:hypothetical protein
MFNYLDELDKLVERQISSVEKEFGSLIKRDKREGKQFVGIKIKPEYAPNPGWSKLEVESDKFWRILSTPNKIPVLLGYESQDSTSTSEECWRYLKNKSIDHGTKHKDDYTITFTNQKRIKILTKDEKVLRQVIDKINETK